MVRASGSKPDSASADSWNLPSRSVKNVNMKNASQWLVCSLNAVENARVVDVARSALQQRLAPPPARRARRSDGAGTPSPTGAAPPRRSPERGSAGRRATAQVAPSSRCCSTDAGSVSPCVTMRRCSCERYSPGTSCQAGSPLCAPKWICRPRSRRHEENAPAVVRHLDVIEVAPSPRGRR